MWNSTISLPKVKKSVQDPDGFVSEEWEYIKNIPANIKDATRLDSTLANQAGYNADVVVEIMACCYNSASFLIDEKTGIIYDIQRTFCKDKAMTMQITAQRREHGKI